jgi:protein SDA1
VVSRAIGVHELQLDNFYPFMMRYLRPSQKEVVAVLAAAVQACHRLVSPEALRPLLLQLVDQFVHDKARPEVRMRGRHTLLQDAEEQLKVTPAISKIKQFFF